MKKMIRESWSSLLRNTGMSKSETILFWRDRFISFIKLDWVEFDWIIRKIAIYVYQFNSVPTMKNNY